MAADIPVPDASGASSSIPARLPPAPWRVFGSPSYFRLWTAQVVSSLGDWIGLIAIIAVAARLSSAKEAAVGLVMVARMLPGFFLAPLGGVLVDRWDRRRTMVICDTGRALIVAYLPFVKTVAGLFVASFFIEILTLLLSPAKEASVPNLVPADKLTTANSLSLVAAYGTFPIGSLLFASLAGLSKWLGHFSALHALRVEQESLALWVDSGTFLLSAVLIFTLATPRREPHEAMAVTRSMWSEAFRDLAHGLRFIASHELVRGVMLGLGAGLFGGGAVIPLGPVYADRVLGAGSAGFGLLMTGLGFGAAAGVLALSPIQRRLPRDQLFASSVVGAGIAIVVASAMSTIIPAVLLVGVLGLCAGAAYVTGFTLIQENVTDELRGRTFATLYTVIRFCLLVSLGLAPLLAGALDSLSGALFAGKAIHVGATRIALPGVRLTLWLGGLVVVVAGGLAAADVRRARRRALGARPS